MNARTETDLCYLPRSEVVALCRELDVVGLVTRVLKAHSEGATTLPEEAYLPWYAGDGSFARSLALPGAARLDRPALGIKIINSCLGNPDRGLPRAQGLTLVFDPDRAHPVGLMEAAHISAMRTAAYTVASARVLAVAAPTRMAVIGAGALGEEHVRALAAEWPAAEFTLFDLHAQRVRELGDRLRADGFTVSEADNAQAAVRAAQIVVTATTTTASYLPYAWLSPGALVAHVSLDDVFPDVVERADLVLVDDWNLVAADDRRLLGRMYRAGTAAAPGTAASAGGARVVDGSLGDILVGRHRGRTDDAQIILSNPFGMGILDIVIAEEVLHRARAVGAGLRLPV
ncbi:ornithine cyclodeaminase [Actinoplanes sp. NPDC051346]|uniref:ornithine cyclodeaminase family protein n=1 Tax=Actinoplanes sp. NPDC051346 TaxID=3155048 RepID=UPI00343DD8E4